MQYNVDLTKYFNRYYELSLPEHKNENRKAMPKQIEKRLYAFKYDRFTMLRYNEIENKLWGISCIPENFTELSNYLENGNYKYTRSLAFLERIRDVLIKYADYSYEQLNRKDVKEVSMNVICGKRIDDFHSGVHDKTVEDYCLCFNGILVIPPVLRKTGSIIGIKHLYMVDVDEINNDTLYSYDDIFNNIKVSTITISGKNAFTDRSKGIHNYIYPIKRSKGFKSIGIFGYITFGFCHSDHPPFSNLPTRDRISFYVNEEGNVRFWHNHVKPLKSLYE